MSNDSQLAIAAPTPVDLLKMAVSQNADIDKLKQLMDLQERWEHNEAEKAYIEAMSAFKANSILILTDKVNKQYDSRYVSLGNLVSTVTPFLSKHGLSVQWEIDQSSGIKVSCVITHVQGHREAVSMTVPPDSSGAKNPIQQIKSAITYAKACTFESICGLASTSANLDDDGNSSAGMDQGWITEQCEWFANAKDITELQKLFKAAYSEASAANDRTAMAHLVKAKDARKKELQ
jgi:hypothetical protein